MLKGLVPSTQYPVPSTRYSVLGTQYSVLSTQYSVFSTPSSSFTRLKINIHNLASIPCCQRLPGRGIDLLVHRANAAVAETDIDRAVQAAQGGDTPLPFATDIRALVVEDERAVEGALQETDVHPACATIAVNVLVVLEVFGACVRL